MEVLYSGLVGAAVGAVITGILTIRHNIRRERIMIISEFVGNRYCIAKNVKDDLEANERFVSAMNKIPIYFNKRNVLDAYRRFKDNGRETNLYDLYYALCKSIQLKPLDSTIFTEPFLLKNFYD